MARARSAVPAARMTPVRRAALLLLRPVAGAALALGPAGPARVAGVIVAGRVLRPRRTADRHHPRLRRAGDGSSRRDPPARLVGEPHRARRAGAGSDSTVVVAAVPEIPDGAYVVAWQVVSQDGHPLSGAFALQVGREAAIDTRDLLASVLSGQAGDGRSSNWRRSPVCSPTPVWPSASAVPRSPLPSGRRRPTAGRRGVCVVRLGCRRRRDRRHDPDQRALPHRPLDRVGRRPGPAAQRGGHRVVQMAVIRLALVVLALPLVARLARGWGGNATGGRAARRADHRDRGPGRPLGQRALRRPGRAARRGPPGGHGGGWAAWPCSSSFSRRPGRPSPLSRANRSLPRRKRS